MLLPCEAWLGGHDHLSRFQKRVDPTTVLSPTFTIAKGTAVPAALHVNAVST
jgi:hypothetical protein